MMKQRRKIDVIVYDHVQARDKNICIEGVIIIIKWEEGGKRWKVNYSSKESENIDEQSRASMNEIWE